MEMEDAHQTVAGHAPFQSRTTIYFLFAIVFVALFGTIGIVGILQFANPGESTALISTLLGFLAPTLLGLMAIIKIQEGVDRTKATYRLVDGQMSEFKAALADLAGVQAELAQRRGVEEGVSQQKQTTRNEKAERTQEGHSAAALAALEASVHTKVVAFDVSSQPHTAPPVSAVPSEPAPTKPAPTVPSRGSVPTPEKSTPLVLDEESTLTLEVLAGTLKAKPETSSEAPTKKDETPKK